jgi:hypothetical protein
MRINFYELKSSIRKEFVTNDLSRRLISNSQTAAWAMNIENAPCRF